MGVEAAPVKKIHIDMFAADHLHIDGGNGRCAENWSQLLSWRDAYREVQFTVIVPRERDEFGMIYERFRAGAPWR